MTALGTITAAGATTLATVEAMAGTLVAMGAETAGTDRRGWVQISGHPSDYRFSLPSSGQRTAAILDDEGVSER